MSASKHSPEIDSYIRTEPEHVRKVLKSLRALIRKAAPAASEKIAWGMPTFYLDGNLIHFAAFKKHLGVFPGSGAVTHFAREFKKLGLTFSKGTVQIPWETPLPTQLLKRIVSFCVKRNLAKDSKQTGTRLQRPTRERHAMPAFVRSALHHAGLMDAYQARPPYQRNDYVGWIGQAAREETKQKRLAQMLSELRQGDRYMKMPYRGRQHRRSGGGSPR